MVDVDINAKIPIIRVGPEEKLLQNGTESESIIGRTQINNYHHHDQSKLKLPVPSFRRIPRQAHMKRSHTAKAFKKKRDGETHSYFHYEEPSLKELDERVEYDMDVEDMRWLETFNNTYANEYKFHLSESDFEKVMDRLEKESYFESSKADRDDRPDIDDDAVCAICGDGDCNNANAIIFCDMCDLAVHQECYGVPYVPLGQWLCKRCQFSPAQNVECCLCPNLGGAFKQTETSSFNLNNDSNGVDKKKNKIKIKPKGWAHVVCALWVPEVAFANTVFLEPIEGIENIEPARWKLRCYICSQKYKGACIQCSKPNCYQPFHVTCAKQAGLYMRIRPHQYESDGQPYQDVIREAFCDKHTPPGESLGGGMYSGDETDEDIDSEQYRKKEQGRRKNIKKTRETLAKQTKEYKKDAAIFKVDEEKIMKISKVITIRGKKSAHVEAKLSKIRHDYAQRVHAYWIEKRKARHGVPLLRRLQVSLNARPDIKLDGDKDKEKFVSLRYDLEKSRMLMGDIKKRERFKMRMIKKGMEIVAVKLDIFDMEHPAAED